MRLLLSSLVLAAAVTASGPALAQLSATDEANARFQTGVKYYEQRDFESARLAFAQSYAVLQKPSILMNLGLSEVYSNHPLEAIPHLEQFIKDASSPADRRERARRALEEAMKKTGHLAVKASPEASVTVDGKPPAQTPPAVVHVAPGAHTVEAKAGAKTKNAAVDAKAGETTNVDVSFDAPPPVAATPVVAQPPPNPVTPVTEPPRELGYTESFWGVRSIGGLAVVGAGAVFVGLGFAAKADESDQSDKLDALSGSIPPGGCAGAAPNAGCAAVKGAAEARNDASARATTFLGVGAAAVGVGGLLVLSAAIWPHRYTRSTALVSPRIIPVTGPKQAGLLFTAEF
ncbi:MAG: hypothetical protein JWP97_5690 [Labilithrix sp.]|nr:hypothetical protein [Labilithrix sp.]